MAFKSSSDTFESIQAPQFYESLPVMDSLMDDGADEFFDVMSTPQRPPKVPEEFFTPAALPDIVPRMPTAGPSTTPMNVTPPAPPAPAKTTLSPVVEEPEPEDGDTGGVERRKSSSDAAQGRVILKARRRSWQAPKPLMEEEIRPRNTSAVDVLSKRVFDGITLADPIPEKEHPMTTRQDVLNKTPKLSLRSRSVIRQQMKRKSTRSPADQSSKPPAKYLAMAEQIEHFFKDTPPRFHSVPASEPPKFPEKAHLGQTGLTQPQSPFLRTRDRLRPPSPPPVEEKVQIKALPLNPKVFQAPDLSSRPPAKPPTVPQPFKLTEVQKKEQKPELLDMVEFKARPIPRSCRSSLSSVCSNASTVSMKRVPAFQGSEVYEERNGVEEKKRVTTHVGVPQSHLSGGKRRVEVKPFSFDMRDRIARQRKEEKIQRAIEESKKVPKFTARPLPSYINASSDTMSDISSFSVSSRRSAYHNHLDESHEKYSFKANPPVVLFKEPFVPKKTSKPLTDITEFQLNTVRRAKERAEYEKAVQKQAEELAEALKKRQEEDEQLEKAQIRTLRKSLVHKAKPVPKFVAAATIKEE